MNDFSPPSSPLHPFFSSSILHFFNSFSFLLRCRRKLSFQISLDDESRHRSRQVCPETPMLHIHGDGPYYH